MHAIRDKTFHETKIGVTSMQKEKQEKWKACRVQSSRTCVELNAEHAGSARGCRPNAESAEYAPGPGPLM